MGWPNELFQKIDVHPYIKEFPEFFPVGVNRSKIQTLSPQSGRKS